MTSVALTVTSSTAHCSPHWCHMLLTRLQAAMSTGAQGEGETRAAIEQLLHRDSTARTAVLHNIEAVLALMAEPTLKRWLLKHAWYNGQPNARTDYAA